MSAIELIETTLPEGQQFFNSKDLTEILGLKPQTLPLWRQRRVGPPYIKCGRSVKYFRGGIIQWMAKNAVMPTTK